MTFHVGHIMIIMTEYSDSRCFPKHLLSPISPIAFIQTQYCKFSSTLFFQVRSMIHQRRRQALAATGIAGVWLRSAVAQVREGPVGLVLDP